MSASPSPARPALGAGLEGSDVIVTGAAGGIGRAVAFGLADSGARVWAVDRPGSTLDDIVAALPGEGHRAFALDLADASAIAPAVSRIAAESGALWGLVHAAAFLRRETLADVTPESWDAQHDVNLRGTFFLVRAVGDALVAAGRGGRIVTFSSIAWQTGPILGSDAYVASKAGVVALTRGFARSLGPAGVTVNCIAPGQIDTPMQRADNTAATMAATAAACPLGRMGTPEEVAAVSTFLLSSHASFVSGATLNVSGGLLMY